MEEEESLEIRSEEVQEIISHTPNGLVRWGLTVIFIVILSLLSITWFIRYPDLMTANVVITTSPAPVNVVARTSGKITLLKQDNEPCQKGEILGFIQSNAEVDAVLQIEQQLLENEANLKAIGSLGDLQPYYSTLINAQASLTIFEETKAFDKQIEQLNRQILTYEKLNKSLNSQRALLKEELQLGYQKFKIDSILFIQKVIPLADFNLAKGTWIQQQRTANSIETSVLNNELQLNQIQKQITDLELQKWEQQQKMILQTSNARNEFMSQIQKWKENYLLTATGHGRLALLGFLEEDMFIEAGRSVLAILPEMGKITARADLPISGSGKVKVGQAVNIRLANYPFEEFGLLQGYVTSISQIPNEQKYYLIISLPEKLITTQNKTLDFKQQLTGTTEIITEDLRLLERFLYQLKKLVQVRDQG